MVFPLALLFILTDTLPQLRVTLLCLVVEEQALKTIITRTVLQGAIQPRHPCHQFQYSGQGGEDGQTSPGYHIILDTSLTVYISLSLVNSLTQPPRRTVDIAAHPGARILDTKQKCQESRSASTQSILEHVLKHWTPRWRLVLKESKVLAQVKGLGEHGNGGSGS